MSFIGYGIIAMKEFCKGDFLLEYSGKYEFPI